ncbi:hypothetical protein KAR91_59480 [Candidatus Pacearchaeota archaeon]|nr:hypothetical protein [Candidatus Pacearchaeota archaeon]
MAGLKANQFEVTLATIYSVERFSDNFGRVSPNIFIDGTGTANIYSSEETPASVGDMVLEHSGISGHHSFTVLPNYIYVAQATATVTKVVLTGVKPVEVV